MEAFHPEILILEHLPFGPQPRLRVRTRETAICFWFFRSIQAGQGIYLLDAHERLRRHVAIRGLFPASQSHLCPVSAGQHANIRTKAARMRSPF